MGSEGIVASCQLTLAVLGVPGDVLQINIPQAVSRSRQRVQSDRRDLLDLGHVADQIQISLLVSHQSERRSREDIWLKRLAVFCLNSAG